MHYRKLGQTGLSVSEIGFGCASFWGKKAFNEGDALKLIHSAVDQGISFFDTGSSYSGGNAEPRLGLALQTIKNRQDLVIASKAGTRLDNRGRLVKDFTSAGIRKSVETSLKNLGLSSLPILHLHGPQINDLSDDLMDCLDKLRFEGKIRTLSVNSFDVPVVEHILTLPQFGAVMIDYNILRPERKDLIEKLATKGFGIFAGMALAGGLYSHKIFYPRKPRDVWYLLRALKNHRSDILRGRHFRFLEQSYGHAASTAALAWVLRNPSISCAVIGTTRTEHLIDNSAASGYVLDGAALTAITEAQRSFA